MNIILRYASYLFHPLWMPFAGALLYFIVTPRFFPETLIRAKLMALAIMTLFIPIVFFFLLKTLRKASTIFLTKVEERNWPLLFHSAILIITLHFVLNPYDFPELYYYFLGILTSTVATLVFVWFKIKISMHLVGLGGILVFITGLSFHFSLDLIYTIAFFIAVTGLTASSRLHFKAHTLQELFLGLLTGLIPQVVFLRFWL